MKEALSDTPPEVRRKRVELIRNLSAADRFQLAIDLTNTVRHLVLADIKHRFPTASDEEIRRRFIARVLSRDEVISTYGFDPDQETY